MKPDIRISAASCILGALALLLLPVRWILGAVLAAAVHELGHLLILKLLRVRVLSITVSFGGAQIETLPLSRAEELLSALAGPVFGLMLIPFAKWVPCTAICAAVQSAYNLLPLGHQDGGRVLRCLLEWGSERYAQQIARAVEVATVGLLAALGIVGTCSLRLGILPLICAMGIAVKTVFRKTPCKSGAQAVQ